MSRNRALIQATPRSTFVSSAAASVVAVGSMFTSIASSVADFFAGSADARQQARHAAYLSEATDLYDLEARVRELEKQSALA